MLFKRSLSILLIIIVLFTVFDFNGLVLASSKNEYDEGKELSKYYIEKIRDTLPTIPMNYRDNESLWRSTNKYWLNTELWNDKDKIIYGEPYDLGAGNDFVETVNGYYTKKDKNDNDILYENGKPIKGEYRYHGFDIVGNKYTNIDFPPDITSGLTMEQKQWHFRSWDDPLGLPAPPVNPSPYNHNAINRKNKKTQQWINDAFKDFEDWDVINGINRDGTEAYKYNEQGEWIKSTDKYDYIHVLSPPTMEETGEGRMWNQSKYSGKNYYQTLSISTLKSDHKQQNPIECTVEILNKENLKLTANEAYIKVDVKVIGEIDDSNVYDEGENDTDKPVYYNREDIKSWKLNLVSNTGYENQIILKEDKGEKQKRVSYTFKDIEISRAQLESNNFILFAGEVQAAFVEGVSDIANDTDEEVVEIEEGEGHKSYFTIFNTITLSHGDNLTPDNIGYSDQSMGDISSYDIEVINKDNGDRTSFNYQVISDLIVNQDIFNFIDIYVDGEDGTNQSEFNFTISQTITTVDGEIDTYSNDQTILIGEYEPIIVKPDVNIPNEGFDILSFNAVDNTDMSTVAEKNVYINGREVNYNSFFSGSYTFGASDKNLLYFVVVEYVSVDGFPASVARWINVRTTKPQIEFSIDGAFKENRKLTIDNTSNSVNDTVLINNYPITYTWSYESIEGDDSNRKIKDISHLYKELLYKEKGIYRITLEGVNSLGRMADPYTFEFTILEDYEPDITMHIWNNVLTRNEKVSINHGVGSIDEDNITSNILEIYYDADNNGECETLLEIMNAEDFAYYQPANLGNYKIISYVEEGFGQETIEEFLNDTDKKTATAERYFFVENVRPMTKIYTDIPLDFPQVDLFIMNDEDLDRTKNNTIRNARIDYKNYLMGESIVADVQVWDMHTYIYSQSASTSRHTGSRYPSSSIGYSSGGYTGTLTRYSVANNRYRTDEGYYKTVTNTDSRYETASRSASGTAPPLISRSASGVPSSISYNSGGYRGTLSETSYTYWSGNGRWDHDEGVWKFDWSRRASYGGTVTRTWTEQVWVPIWVWHNNYTGYYSGTIYKNVRQPYENPFKNLSDKYLVYISDGDISQLNDLQMVLDDADVKLILIGDNTIQSQMEHDYYFENNKPVDEIMIDVMSIIETENPYDSTYKLLQGQTFIIDTADYDEEDDPIIEEYFQYVHNPEVFDNNQGLESYAKTTYDEYNWTTFKASQFTKKGYYEIYRRIKDNPSTDSNFADFAMYSNQPKINLIVHEKPIADCTLDWDYDPVERAYKTTWIDKSYDPDYQYRRTDKGIAERKIMYRRNNGEWIYKVPDNLSPGTYQMEYYVKDIQGAWSEPHIMNFTLNTAPSIQLNALLMALEDKFTIDNIPASEYLELYNVWSRYPYSHKLEISLYNGSTRVSSVKTIDYYTGTKIDNDINWDNITYQVPETLEDGHYTLKLKAVDTGIETVNKELNFNVNLSTPVDLDISLVPDELTSDDTSIIQVQTSKYVDEVEITLYEQTEHQITDYMTLKSAGDIKTWEYQYHIPGGIIPEGDYNAKFTASTPNNNTETKIKGYKHLDLKLEDLRIIAVYDYGWQYKFEKTNREPTDLQLQGIRTKDFPLLHNDRLKDIKLGYAVDFKIDSTGLSHEEDTIDITVHYYAFDKYAKYQPVDIYIPDEKYENYYKLEDSEYLDTSKRFTLTKDNKTAYESDPDNLNKNTWRFRMFLPPTAKAVKKGEPLDLYSDNTFKRRLLVLLEIEAKKHTGTVYDYTLKETDWGTDDGDIYGVNKPSGLNLLGKGINHGEVFYYHLENTLLDDIKIQREW